MTAEKVDETKVDESNVDEPKVDNEVNSQKVSTERTVDKRNVEDTGGAGSSSDQRPGALKKPKVENWHGEKRPGDENVQSTRRVKFEKKHGEKRAGEENNQPTRRAKVVEPQGEKRKEMETDFEENLRSLQAQAHNLGLSKTDVLDIRGCIPSNATEEQMTQKMSEDKPMIFIGGLSGSSFSRLRNLQKFSAIVEK